MASTINKQYRAPSFQYEILLSSTKKFSPPRILSLDVTKTSCLIRSCPVDPAFNCRTPVLAARSSCSVRPLLITGSPQNLQSTAVSKPGNTSTGSAQSTNLLQILAGGLVVGLQLVHSHATAITKDWLRFIRHPSASDQ